MVPSANAFEEKSASPPQSPFDPRTKQAMIGANNKGAPVPGHFEDIVVGQVISLGAMGLDAAVTEDFIRTFSPGWDPASGAPDAMIYAVWCKLDLQSAAEWPQTKRLAVDALRWARNPPPGELLRGRMTILGKDQVGESKGLVMAQHDLLDEAGRLVFSCLTRSVFACRGD